MSNPAEPQPRHRAALALLLAVLAAPVGATAAGPMHGIMDRGHEASLAPEPVDEVLAAAVYVMKGTPVQLRVDAAGRTSRPGHGAGILIPHLSLDPAPNGIYEMTFETFPARGVAAQSGDRIEVINFWKTFPPDLVGVRIYGARNCVEVFIHPKYQHLRTGRCAVAAP
ncbi:MAG: hypothetical protein IRY94_01935 [Rhodospirillaceae bacterium]|nr:hypothetical protein [Rhodospirillaceae bacterium]